MPPSDREGGGDRDEKTADDPGTRRTHHPDEGAGREEQPRDFPQAADRRAGDDAGRGGLWRCDGDADDRPHDGTDDGTDDGPRQRDAVRVGARQRGAREPRRRSPPIPPRRSSRTSRRTPTITFWTFYLSPTFDQYIKDTIARFEATYPGVTVNWEDHQATFKDDLNNAFNAGNAPDVINLSVSEGWVSEYAGKGVLLPLDDKVPAAVKDVYFPGLWKEQLIDGVNFQFPWYQGLNVDLLNKAIFDKARSTSRPSRRRIDGLPALCETFKDKAGNVCTIRLTVSDLLAQMVYEGNVKVLSR